MFEDVQKDNEELDQASTGQPVAYDSSTLDFGIQGLFHSSVEEAEHVRARELTDRSERHRHQDELQADLRQNNVYIPFSENRKKMIHDMGNVECFQLCETDSQVPCSYCLFYWTKDIVHRTCGICLCHTDEMRRRNRKRVDALSISNNVIKKGFSHGVRHGNSEEPTNLTSSGLQRMETMSKEERCTRRKLHRNSGQIFEKSAISQITRRTWMGRS